LKQALVNMLAMQHRMNARVHEHWVDQDFAWYRAAWIECGELIEHYGYKWWKKQQPEMEQVRLEVVDIWHFGLSALFSHGKTVEHIADDILVALHCLQTRGFSPSRFWDLMLATGLDFDSLYSAYVGKNVLNFFRQDHGYKEGSYRKHWGGREDNEHLSELVAALDHNAEDFADQVYAALAGRYRELVPAQ
jgi:dUTPase